MLNLIEIQLKSRLLEIINMLLSLFLIFYVKMIKGIYHAITLNYKTQFKFLSADCETVINLILKHQ